jgi:aminoglycoside 6-adenylyltransferase
MADAQVQTEEQVIAKIINWANDHDDVRAVLITSTRAIEGGKTDAYSDYDVIMVVEDITVYAEREEWLSAFGELVIAYWDPIGDNEDVGEPTSGSIIQYASGLNIDFGLWPTSALARLVQDQELPEELDAGYKILLDKDDLASRLPKPTFRGYIPQPPDEATYRRLITDFYIGPPQVATGLIRGDLVIVKWILDYDMRHVYLQPMIDWWIEVDHGWQWKPGNLGKGIQDVLPPQIWAEVRSTYVGPETDDNWRAMFAMMALFGRLARAVGDSLGYEYPQQLEDRVTEYVARMQAGIFAGGPLNG